MSHRAVSWALDHGKRSKKFRLVDTASGGGMNTRGGCSVPSRTYSFAMDQGGLDLPGRSMGGAL
jgi:hypothetical protein